MSAVYVGEIAQCIREAYHVSPKNTPMFWGPPGVGKTHGVLEARDLLAKEYENFEIAIFITSQMESIDFSMPTIITTKEGVKSYVKLPISDFILLPNTRKIIFFDELPNAAPDVQKAAQSIITDRKIHETKLPDGVMLVAAGNRKEDRAGSNNLLSAHANRLEHYDVKSDFQDWEKWAMRVGIHHSILSYLKVFPQNLYKFDVNNPRNPTPRVWEALSNYMYYYEKHQSEFVRRRIASRVGDSIAGEFMAHLRHFEKFPTKEEIIKDPESARLPSEGDVQYALTIAILNWSDKKTASKMIQYALRLNKEFQGTYFTQLKKFKPECAADQPEFTKWAHANLHLIKA